MNDAYRAIASGQNRLGALTAAEVIERASDIGDDDTLAMAYYWAAYTARELGHYPRALQLIMDGESKSIVPDSYQWRRRLLQFSIVLQWRPKRGDLNEHLENLKNLARQRHVPAGDLPYAESSLYEAIGDLALALRKRNQAYREQLREIGDGIVAHCHAEYCARICIKLQDFVSAEDWISKIHVEEDIDEGWGPYIDCVQDMLRLELARAQFRDVVELQKLLGLVEESSRRVDAEWITYELYLARFRVALLDPTSGDPETIWHPARAACRYRFKERLNVHRRFQHNLKLLDFRLAALRFACGLVPIDDEFAGPPSCTFSCNFGLGWDGRLRRARRALAVAYRHAQRIDAMLECNWRREMVCRRAAWIEAIAATFTTPLSSSI